MLLLLSLLLASADPALAAPPAAAADDEIVVRARREAELNHLIEEMAPSRMGRQIARWDDRICSHMYGLEAEHAAFVKARIDGVAADLGIATAKSAKCIPNVIVVFTLDADPFTAAFVRRYPEMIGEIQLGAVNARRKAPYLAPHPVRWFAHDLMRRDELPVMSRIHTNQRQVITASYVIVDLNRLAGLSWGQLADFIAFVSLARPEFDKTYTDPGTILSLFTARDAGTAMPAGLTTLDCSFLTNLYDTAGNRTAQDQRRDIRRHVKADLAADGGERCAPPATTTP